MQNQSSIKFRDIPFGLWLFGFVSLGAGIYVFPLQGFSPTTVLLAGIGLVILLLTRGLTIIADRNTRILQLNYWSLYFLRTTRKISFDEIATIRVDSSQSMERSGHQTRSYRIEVVRRDNSIVPFRKYYSGGFFSSMRKQKIVDQLRAFIGLGEAFDESPAGFMRAINQAATLEATRQQEALTGPNAQEQVTNGVHWQIQSTVLGTSPVTRWYSTDFKMGNGFLFVAQKVSGQPTGGIMAAIGKALFQQSISLYGFKAEDTPNVSQAMPLAPVPPLIDFHFTAFTNNQAESRQILNPWTQNPLAEWAQRHPLQQLQSTGSFSQLVVLFSPNGVYVATLGTLQPGQVEELTDLGVEMVRTQGAIKATQ
ncbi:MAG: hypothetical protein EHM40_06005 [Chloroflexi bacterium]|nr:MAG: hypothetical protein EHM40_06005 [Chloroflexota bacterium]